MKKFLIVGVGIFIALFIGMGFLINKDTEVSHHLVITEVLWNEYSISEGKTFEIDLVKGNEVKINNDWHEVLTIEVIEENKKSVVIKTNQAMSIQKESQSGINLKSNDTDFILKKGNSIKLSTLTMDAGAVYKIEYK